MISNFFSQSMSRSHWYIVNFHVFSNKEMIRTFEYIGDRMGGKGGSESLSWARRNLGCKNKHPLNFLGL